jgi:hypothetical protein
MILGQGAEAHGLRSRRQQVVSVAKGLVVLVQLVQIRVLNLKENCVFVAVSDESMGVQNRPLHNSKHNRKLTFSVSVFLPQSIVHAKSPGIMTQFHNCFTRLETKSQLAF